MSNRLNGGFMGYDGRFLTSGTTVGHIQREQYFLERTQNRLGPVVPPPITGITGPYLKTLLFENFEGGTNFINGSNYTWIVANGAETNYWVVGDDRTTQSGGTNAAYITNGTGTATNGDNVYTDAGGSDTHITLQFQTPTDWWRGSGVDLMNLSFDWRLNGENGGATTHYDYGYLRFTSTATTTDAGTNYAPPGQVGGGDQALYDVLYQTPQNYTQWWTQGQSPTGGLTGWSGVTAANITWSWHDDAAGGTVGNPPFAIDNIMIIYTACTTNC